ncbi:DUF3558 family protein [Amycolatopsis magusensis]|uniref:DUF3558 family protein n=1 Tax=Amycolatopsis magusensis TaxID=882444 RepID=UPI0037903E90
MWAAVTAVVVVLLAGCSFGGPVHGSSMAPPPSTPTRSAPAQTDVSTSVDARAYVAEPCQALPPDHLRDLQTSPGRTHNLGDISSCTWVLEGNAELALTLSQNSTASINTLADEDPIRGARFKESSIGGHRALVLEPSSPRAPDCAVHIAITPALALSIRVTRFLAAGSCFLAIEIANTVVPHLQRHG